jgi:protein-disulfide isomerase
MQTLAPDSMAKTVATVKPHLRKFFVAFAATALVGGASALLAQAKPNWLLTFTVSPKGGHIIGNPAAPNKIVEYASYTCGHCAHFEADDVPLVKNQLVATGKASLEIRNLVRDPLDLTAAVLARCGGKGRFFGNHKLLMATQAQWTQSDKLSKQSIALLEAQNTVGFMQAAYTELGFDKIMVQRGISAAQGKACLADKAAFNAVIAMSDEAIEALKINSTPTVLVNGKIIEGHKLADIRANIRN